MKSTLQTDFTLSGSLFAGDQLTDHHKLYGTSSLGDYLGGSYTEFSNDGTLRLKGNATTYDDLRVNLANLRSPAAQQPIYEVYNDVCELPAFQSGVFNRLYFTAQLPHSWKQGSDIYFHVHVANPVEIIDPGTSYWKFEYAWANKDETISPSAALYKLITHSTGEDGQHKIIPFATISGTGKTLSSILICSIARLGNNNTPGNPATDDNFGQSVYGLMAGFHFEMDSFGSNEVYTKL